MAGPQECTALGNVMLQARAAGLVGDLSDMRRVIAENVAPTRFEPQQGDDWDAAFARFLDFRV